MVLKSLQPETVKELQNISMAVNLCKLMTSISSFLKREDNDGDGDGANSSDSSFKSEKRWFAFILENLFFKLLLYTSE